MKSSFRLKFRYWFDNTLNSGTVALIGWLGLVSIVVVIIAAIVATIFDIDPQEKDIQFIEALWISLMRTLDPGNLSSDNGWSFRAIMLLVTVVGILIVSSLIGIVNAGITGTLENLRKGRSFVSEKDHILIFGWSPLIFSLLTKLSGARRHHERLVIVILADKDKIEMEEEIKEKTVHDKNVKIVLRSGSMIDRNDIEIVNPHEARTIVVMGQENDIHDTHSIKTTMALMKSHNRKSERYHIIVEVRDRENLEVLEMIGKDEITPIVSEELFSRITVQTSLQSGLSEVYNELLDFNDIDTEFIDAKPFAGSTYGEAVLKFREGMLIGIQRPGRGSDANPATATIILEGDTLIVITRKEQGIKQWTPPAVNSMAFAPMTIQTRNPQHTLLLGWNAKASEIIATLDKHFPIGSEITVFADTDGIEEAIDLLRTKLVNQQIQLVRGNTRSKKHLTEQIVKGNYRHVILLGYEDSLDIQSADALTLITLIHLRQIAEEGNLKFTIVSEILDIRNRALAEVTHADDFIVSDNLISMVMAQLACNIRLKEVFDELLTPGGSEICLRPVADYITIGTPVTFLTVASSAARYDQTVIGYRFGANANNSDLKYGVVLAPPKDQPVNFEADDKIILISDL